jgi:DNA-directed RNA polymerase subunit alpha
MSCEHCDTTSHANAHLAELANNLQRDNTALRARLASASQELAGLRAGGIGELGLSVRAENCLEASGIKTIKDLVQRTERDLSKIKNLGRKSLREVREALQERGLRMASRRAS